VLTTQSPQRETKSVRNDNKIYNAIYLPAYMPRVVFRPTLDRADGKTGEKRKMESRQIKNPRCTLSFNFPSELEAHSSRGFVCDLLMSLKSAKCSVTWKVCIKTAEKRDKTISQIACIIMKSCEMELLISGE
jgi:hypothetical protein